MNLKAFLCLFRGDHYPIDLDTLKCKICGKQFRVIPMGEYLGKLGANEPCSPAPKQYDVSGL